MTNSFASRAHCTCFALTLPIVLVSAPANAARPLAVLTYFLPKTIVSASVSQQLMSCPPPDDGEVVVATGWTLKAITKADYSLPINVDASSGFLTKRSVALKLNPDGTINAFNSESAGQGGAVIASLLKLVGTVAPMISPLGASANFETSLWRGGHKQRLLSPCTKPARDLLEKREQIEATIAKLEEAVAAGDATPAQIRLLTSRQEALADVNAKLTLSSEEPVKFDPGIGPQFQNMEKLDYSPWFGSKSPPVKIVGSDAGFCAEWAASKAAIKSLKDGDGTALSKVAAPRMYYRRPVPALLVAGPARQGLETGSCSFDETAVGSAATEALSFGAPQLSGFYSVPIGSGGLFSSRAVQASFDPSGAPIELSLGSDPGAAAIAGTIDAVGATATALHNAELDALTHEIAVREKRKELAALRNEP